MSEPDTALPEPNRSASEIEFVLRNAKKKSGPELLRDLARAGPEQEQAPAKR